MKTEEPPLSASTTSLLDKPLHQLTEDDISQLTREDCRRYLKQKGMRRPSWNKSQAIQQVIMLKALLEPSPDSDGCSRKLRITHLQQETPTTRERKGTSADTEVSVSADESIVPGHRHDMHQSVLHGDNEFIRPGITSVTDEGKGQMAIFYSGKVNVYDDVPAEKAQNLFKIAASPLQFPEETPFDTTVSCHLQAPDSAVMPLPTIQTGEVSSSRKASVQRYLEKRKDRFKSKKIQNQNQKEQSNRSYGYGCSPPPPQPDTRVLAKWDSKFKSSLKKLALKVKKRIES